MNTLFANWEYGWLTTGWTMIHFLWLGPAVALCGGAIHRACRSSTATFRYFISLSTLAGLAALPIVIAVWLGTNTTSPIVLADGANDTIPHVATSLAAPRDSQLATPPTPQPPASFTATPETHDSKPGTIPFLENLATHLPWLWLIGAPLTFALLATGLVGAERLRRRSQPVNASTVSNLCDQLRKTLRISHTVSIAVCDSLAQPILVGIVRPLILLPPAALTGWSPQHLEMVLLHELAHVRRWDNLVNFMQRVVESLLFFHPAVWIVSRQVRHDREECCDAVVVAHTAKPQAYAELLVALAAPPPPPLVGLALSRHPLTGRIRRILKLEDEPMLVSRKTLGLVGVALAASLAVVLWQPLESSVAKETAVVDPQETITIEDTKSTEEEVRSWFQESESNPMRKINYKFREHFHGQLSDMFEGMQKDPYGPQLEFRSGRRSNTMEITAPAQAHENLFKRMFIDKRSPFAARKEGEEQQASRVVPDPSQILPPQTLSPDLYRDSPVYVPKPHESLLRLGDRLHLDVAGDFPDRPISGDYTIESTGTLALGATYGRVKVVGKTLLDAEKEIDKHLKSILNDSAVQLTIVSRNQVFVQPTRVYPNSGRYNAPAGRSSWPTALTTPVPVRQPPWSTPSNHTLLYDGKTFDQWRRMWKTELKTEKRTECIKALAAFGRAGRGKEAVEAILDVASEYDFSDFEDDVVGEFKKSVPEQLTKHFPASLWLPSFLHRYKLDEKKWEVLGYHLLDQMRMRAIDEPSRQTLFSIANSEHLLHAHATRALLRGDHNLERPETVKLARMALQGDQPDFELLRMTRFRYLDRVPEQFDLFFHEKLTIRQWARRVLSEYGGGPQSEQLYDKFLMVLDDPAQAEKHRFAIRALPHGNRIRGSDRMIVAVAKIAREGDEQLLGPSLYALEKLLGGDLGHVVDYVESTGELSEERKKILHDGATRNRLVTKERVLARGSGFF